MNSSADGGSAAPDAAVAALDAAVAALDAAVAAAVAALDAAGSGNAQDLRLGQVDTAIQPDGIRPDVFVPPGRDCPGPTNEGAFIPAVQGRVPTFEGGSIEAGLYRLTGFLIAAGSTTDKYRWTMNFLDNRIEEMVEVMRAMPPDTSVRFNGTWSTADTTLRIQRVCGSNLELVFKYSASPGKLVLGLGPDIFTYTKL